MEKYPSIYVLIGSPGSGKGTFTQTLLPEGYVSVSTGDITREEIEKKTPFGTKYKEAILKHLTGVIPNEEIQNRVEQRVEEALRNQKGVILDGYPKSVEQCRHLDQLIEKFGLENQAVYLLFDVEENEAVERILYRQLCAQCNKIYHSKWAPPKVKNTCDACYGKLYRRSDTYSDGMEGAKKRVYTFKERLGPVINYYNCRLKVLNTNAPLKECIEHFHFIHQSLQPECALRK